MTRAPAILLVMVLALLATACTAAVEDDATAAGDTASTTAEESTPVPTETTAAGAATTFGPPPPVPDGPMSAENLTLLEAVVATPQAIERADVTALRGIDDPRALWLISDLLRFPFLSGGLIEITEVAAAVSGLDLSGEDYAWGPLTDHLIAWDLPAYDGYVAHKARLFTAVEPAWAPFFDDVDAAIDWRLVSWGGVLIDDRPFGDPDRCPRGCIPSLDDPALTPASEGGWYPDDAIVFGVEIGGETVAFPKNIMEVHEMVNMTVGGRQIAMPYCTLCAAAQVFLTDTDGGGTGDIVMRTSGLLHRSNKVMYDLTTSSVFDTFTGEAVSGPLQEEGVVLQQATVVTSTWAAWRAAHPDTQIVAEDGGIGRSYELDPLRGRDDDGPIFPIGDVDDRLPVQAAVLGVQTPAGTFVAFPVIDARATLLAGEIVEAEGITVVADGTGVRAEIDGEPYPSHQAFWFAWSQFHPDTLLWRPDA